MWTITDEPTLDFLNYDSIKQKELSKCPVCNECKMPIQTDWLYEFNEIVICEDCMSDHMHSVDGYV